MRRAPLATPITQPWHILVLGWFALAALFYVSYGVAAILRLAPHALYADQWRQYVDYVQLSFPWNVLHPDNGHRLLLPNLIAWIELRWFAGNQWLQIACGIASALVAAMTAAAICLRDESVLLARRSAAMFLSLFAILWLGNARTLFHSTELLHTTLPMLCLMLALAACLAATRDAARLRPLVLALLCALAASFSFGYGMAVFVGIFGTLMARKATFAQLALWFSGLVATAALYLLLPGTAGVTASMGFAPLQNLLTAARWLGAPFVAMFKYLWDPAASGLVPTQTLQHAAHAIAIATSPHLPDMHTGVMPYALFGALGMLALSIASLRRLLAHERAGAIEALGFGIAWFGLAAAGIVSISRLTYFEQYPDQIYAERYLPWPCLFWLGLALIALGAPLTKRQIFARATFAFALLLPLLAWPIEFGGGIYAALVRGQIDNTAAGSIVGVIERDVSQGETDNGEFARGYPVLRPLRVAQFADPALDLIGKPLPSSLSALDARIETRHIDANAIGDPGTAVTLHLAPMPPDAPEHLLLIDAADTVVGLVARDARVGADGYSGYARGVHEAAELRVVATP